MFRSVNVAVMAVILVLSGCSASETNGVRAEAIFDEPINKLATEEPSPQDTDSLDPNNSQSASTLFPALTELGADFAEDKDETPDADGNPENDGENKPASTELKARLYPGWCQVGPSKSMPNMSVVSTVSPGGSIQAAIDNSSNGIVQLNPGVHTISQPINMKSGVFLRGSGATIQTSTSMGTMISLGPGASGTQSANVTSANAFSKSVAFSGGTLSPGFWRIGDSNTGQLVRVLSVNGSTATLELPLARNFAGQEITSVPLKLSSSGIEGITLEPLHSVENLVTVKSAHDVWVKDIATKGSRGQIKAAIHLTQSYRVAVTGNTITNAKEHGNGGRGYGINIANNVSNSLIQDNMLRQLRHSILIQVGASGNVVRDNDSAEPIHPHFVNGGPADISFHGYSAANLVMSNQIERIQINDAGVPGPHNTIAFNTLTSGPLTLDNEVDNLTLLGNKMLGSVGELRSKTMPVANNRKYWTDSYDPFAGPSGTSQFTKRAKGILDWGSGNDVFVDEDLKSLDICSL